MYAILLLVESCTLLMHTCTHTHKHIVMHICEGPWTHADICSDTLEKDTHISASTCTHTHTQGRYNMINGRVSLTLINYNQIKDFISPNLGSVFGHTVKQRCVIFATHDFSFFFSRHKSLLSKRSQVLSVWELSHVMLISVKRWLCFSSG